jgi:antitoxin VapB
VNAALEIDEKTDRLVRLMTEEDLGGVLINAQHNFAWLTCGGTNGIDQSREAGAGSLFVRRDGKRFALANRIEMPRLVDEVLNGQNYESIEFGWEDEKANPAMVVERARSLLGSNRRVGSDLPVGGSDKVVESALTHFRSRLTQPEVDRYRLLGRDAGEAIGRMVRNLQPGMTESEIANRGAEVLGDCGARAVVALVGADQRMGQYRHPVATERRWEKSVMVVICARRGGLIVSLTRIACIGAADDGLRRRTEACARVNAELFAATRPEVTGRELYLAASRGYEREGFSGEERRHHQGGATGYRTREWVAHPQCEERVQSPQAFAWNPSITGTKVEETCIAFGDRVDVVTASPDWPRLTVDLAGQTYAFPDVLVL